MASRSSPSEGFSLQGQVAIGPGVTGVGGSVSVPLWTPGTGPNKGFQNPLDYSNYTLSSGGGVGPAGPKTFGAGLFLVATKRIYSPNRNAFNEDAFQRLQDDQQLRMHLQQVALQQAKAVAHTPGDPNDISGPAGYGIANFVTPTGTFPYEIDFENEPTADAPAQVVTVTEQLDANLDWSTFELGDFGFGGQTFTVPAGLDFYQTRIDASATVGVYVDVAADFDALTGRIDLDVHFN